jgi:hypothetical protein
MWISLYSFTRQERSQRPCATVLRKSKGFPLETIA